MSKHLVVALLLLLCLAPRAQGAENVYLDELIAQARALHLADRPEWRALLHYRRNRLFPGVTSLVVAPEFFNAPDGRTDPEAELEATLASFFRPPPAAGREPAQCAFIARYHWLDSQLHFDPKRLVPQPCDAFAAWRASMDPVGLTLIFPTAYMNNPASMFGHTFLRVDGKGQNARTRLLAYSVNYAAATDEGNGIVFAYKGVFGGYPGVFGVAPYYMKVKEYSDLENRDIWEYQLNLTPAEINLLLMHAWELRRAYFRYYFFNQNCSYQLLSLLDVARPSLHLTRPFRWWAIPVDTVREVVQVPGMLKGAVYRPSELTRMRYRVSRTPRAEQRLALGLALRRIPLDDPALMHQSADDRAQVLDLAYDDLEYRRVTGQWAGKGNATRELAILDARSKLEVNDPPLRVPTPAVRPEEGHRTARLDIGYGVTDGRRYAVFKVRPAYTDLLDPPGGYVPGAQIEFLSLALRRYQDNGEIRLDHFKVIDIASLSPRNMFLHPISWNARLGVFDQLFPDGSRHLVSRLDGGSGLTYAPFAHTMVFGFLNGALEASSHLHRGYAIGLGPRVGVLVDPVPRWGLELAAQSLRFAVGDAHTEQELSLAQRLSLGRQSALRLKLARHRAFGDYWNSAELSWNYYF